MTRMINCGSGADEIPMVRCEECDVRFGIFWDRRPDVFRIDFCPFCGDAIEGEYVNEDDE